ncbi:MAG: GatB/YqeY domain-containing protein [Vicinamibacterales bacterium]|nr:GatB/YqeY domain-containing protein [Vicinamibacterales bacterium]
MGLIQDVQSGMTQAMKARDPARLSTLRMLKTAFVNKEVEKGRPLDETEALAVVASLMKQRRDSIDQFGQAGRTDLVDKETAELKILEGFLPPALDPADVARVVAEAVAESGATTAKDMGKAMKAAMAKLAGTGVDGKIVSELVRKQLAG